MHANYTREAASDKIKKFYSMMSQAAIRSKADGKDWEDWADLQNTASDSTGDTAKKFADEYILPYLNYYKTEQSGKDVYIYLNDGTYFRTFKGGCLDFIFDTNGGKKPNKEGRDIFRFLYCPNSNTNYVSSGKFIPYLKAETQTREEALALCKSEAIYCSGLLSFDGWEFKKDYPYGI